MFLRRCVAAGLSVVTLAACTNEEPVPNGEPTTPTQTVTASVAPDGPEVVTTPPPIFEEDDEVLNVAVRDPSTLDPMRVKDPGSVLVARQLFEGLTRWDPVEDRVRPAGAQSWKAEAGGRRFVFRLRPGMSFHDGSPVTSDDFAFAFNRIALKENASDLAYTLEKVQGFVSINQLGDARQLTGLRTPDPLTLVIELSEPFYDFPAVLTHPGLVPVPRHAVRDVNDFLVFPVGNGPFRIAQPWRPGEPVLLRAFAGFYDTPELDGIRFLPYADAAASWLQFVEGDLDVAEVPAGQVEGAEEAFGDRGFQPFLAGYYYGFNVKAEGLSKLRVRKAVSRAIDRETIASTIYKQTMGPPRGIVPTGMPGFEENICIRLCAYSPGVAERIVDRMPPRKREVVLEFNTGQPHPRVARAIRNDLEAVGLEVRTRSFGFRRYLKMLRDGKQSIYRYGWIAEYPVPDVFLSSLFQSSSPDNHSGFASDKVDRLLARAHSTRSGGKRVQLYKDVEEAILRQVPVVPIGSFVIHWAAQADVIDIFFDEMGGFDAVNVSFESEDEQ